MWCNIVFKIRARFNLSVPLTTQSPKCQTLICWLCDLLSVLVTEGWPTLWGRTGGSCLTLWLFRLINLDSSMTGESECGSCSSALVPLGGAPTTVNGVTGSDVSFKHLNLRLNFFFYCTCTSLHLLQETVNIVIIYWMCIFSTGLSGEWQTKALCFGIGFTGWKRERFTNR